jgi:putative ABC transport system substrate-binding protein
MIQRREFITLLGGAAAWPLAARAQRVVPVIGFLNAGSSEQNTQRVAAFRKGLAETGFVEGRNVAIEFRWADGHNDQLEGMVVDLIRRRVAVIATPGSTDAALAAKAASTTVPIVFGSGGDPVALGLVAGFNRPGGNITGVTSMSTDLAAKRLGLIHELIPQATRYVALVNPTSVLSEAFIKDLQAGATRLGIGVQILHASTAAEIDSAFAKLSQQPGAVLMTGPDAFFYIRRTQIIVLAARHAVPVMFDDRDFAAAGGLMSYGADFFNVMQWAGVYTGRILKGENPVDLPVMQSTKYEFLINLQTAKTLGISVPPTLLALADEIIE